ncbi:MAG: transketolase [Coriobacteriales bacterium]|jgi:transketolase|nr:transketolase [Coriobacteriales bacterium]
MAFDEADIRRRAAELRCDILKMIALAGSGHPGGSLSAADMLAVLYFGEVLRYRPDDPAWDGRDRFVLSKGHAAPVLYAALARAGYFALSELATLRRLGSRLQGHPDSRKLPGVEAATGSLGQGLSIAAGMALGLAADGHDGPGAEGGAGTGAGAEGGASDTGGDRCLARQVYVLLGDGELQEGQVWEAAMFAAHRRLGNLVALVDENGLQIDGPTDEVLSLGDVAARFAAFGWAAHEVDGHDVAALKRTLGQAAAYGEGPTVVVAHTVKGKGVDFMEGQCGWHGKAPTDAQCDVALAALAPLAACGHNGADRASATCERSGGDDADR